MINWKKYSKIVGDEDKAYEVFWRLQRPQWVGLCLAKPRMVFLVLKFFLLS
jgi:hypothetical protein